MRDNLDNAFGDQEYTVTGKYIFNPSCKDTNEFAALIYVRGSSKWTVPIGGGRPPVMIMGLSYKPTEHFGIQVGGGLNMIPESQRGRIRGTIFFQNYLYYIEATGESGGISGNYWKGVLNLKVFPYLNVGFEASKNEIRGTNPEDGWGPKIEINVLHTPFILSGGMIVPWKESPEEIWSIGGYFELTASF